MTDRVQRLESHVRALAGEIGERNVFTPGSLEATADWIEERWAGQGYEVERLPYESRGHEVCNLEVRVPASGQRGTDEDAPSLVIGAHYDTVEGCPGADDNASAVASLLEISRAFAPDTSRESSSDLRHPLRFVAFVNEEPPFMMEGSGEYARGCKERGEELLGMISLEMLGCYHHQEGSQKYPPLISWLYPDEGNFIAFVAKPSQLGWFRRCLKAFRKSTDFPSEGAVLPGFVPGVSWSDHASFWRQGYPALMVTDTSFYRYVHYHLPTDTPEKLDYEAMAEVVDGLVGTVERLGGGR